MLHGQDRVQGLEDKRRPEIGRRLQRHLQTVSWMRTAFPGLAAKEAPSRTLFEV